MTKHLDSSLTADRRDALREYFRAVARDLLARGAIRYQRGERLDGIVHREIQTILQEVSSDFGAVMKEMGFGLLSGLGNLVGAVLSASRR
jgi:hypothetical protein